jgi:PmbA protein
VSPEELLALATGALEGARGDEAVEAFATHSVETSVDVFEGEVETLSSAETRGVGVRVIVDGRLGFASTADVSPAGLAFALAEARSNAAFATPDAGNELPSPMPAEPLAGIDVPGLDAVPAARKVELALELERLTRAADPRVTGVASASYGDSRSAVAVASTTGVFAAYAGSDVYAHVSSLARDGEETQTGFGLTQGRSVDELDLAAAAREGAERATRLLGGTRMPTAQVPVVFDPLVTAQFLGALSAAFSAEAVQKGRSLLAGSMGQPVADPALSIVDDGRLLEGPAAAPVDDEGVPTGRTVLVRDGVLMAFLHNAKTAARQGNGARSTGNAARGGYRTPPGVAPGNLYFAGTTRSRTEVLAAAGTGLYVQDAKGVHSGVNPVSGEFSVGVTGLWIRGGELAEPVREITVSSTLLEMLRSVAALGNDRRFFPIGGSVAGATLLITGMVVAGS